MKLLSAFVLLFCFSAASYAQEKTENLKITWPEEYKWRIASSTEDSLSHILEIIPGDESLKKWSILGYMQSVKRVVVPNLDIIINAYSKGALKDSPKGKFTVLEKDAGVKHFWILYKLETPNFPDDPTPESQLWYIIQGDKAMYVNFVAIKEATLSDSFVAKWTKVFKGSELTSEGE
jgi:hypothetical protein